MPVGPSPLSLFKDEIQDCIIGNEQSRRISSLIEDLRREVKDISINGKPCEVYLNMTAEELAVADPKDPGKSDIDLINKLIAVMNTEFDMKLLPYKKGDEALDPNTANALRIFTQRSFSHMSTNLLVKSLGTENMIPMNTSVKMDIKKETKTELNNTITTGLILTNTSSVLQAMSFQGAIIPMTSGVNPLITCTTEVTLPMKNGYLEDNENKLIVDNISISSTSTHEKFESLSTAINHLNGQVDVKHLDFEMLDPLTLLKDEILDAKAKFKQPEKESLIGRYNEWRNAPKREALEKALECLNSPTAEKVESLKMLAKKNDIKPIKDFINRAVAESEKVLQPSSTLQNN